MGLANFPVHGIMDFRIPRQEVEEGRAEQVLGAIFVRERSPFLRIPGRLTCFLGGIAVFGRVTPEGGGVVRPAPRQRQRTTPSPRQRCLGLFPHPDDRRCTTPVKLPPLLNLFNILDELCATINVH
jgi:hypothetical protein